MSSIIVALITTLGVILNTVITNKTNKKIENIDNIKIDFKKELDNVKRENDKTYLTDFLSDLEKGQPKSDIQIRRGHEIYKEYRDLDGNSYIHNKWEKLVKEGVL